MPTSLITSSARSGFVLGLSAGLVLASAVFLIRGQFAAHFAGSGRDESSDDRRRDAVRPRRR